MTTALFLLGYGLAIPIAMRMTKIVAQQHRLAFAGHQVGVGIALLAWVLRGSIMIAAIHVAWLGGVRLWFHVSRPKEQPST